MFIPSIVDPKIFCSTIFFFCSLLIFNLRIIVDKISVACSLLFIFRRRRQSCDCRLLNRLKPQNWFNLIIKTMSSLCSHGTEIRFYCSFFFLFRAFFFLVLALSIALSSSLFVFSSSVIRSFSFAYTLVPMWYLCSLFCVLCAQVCLAKLRSRDSFGFGETN